MLSKHLNPDNPTETCIEVAGLSRELSLLHLTDSHMALADERDPLAIEAAQRFGQLFTERTPGKVGAAALFDQALGRARDADVDCALLTGDIIHFPSKLGLAKIRRGLQGLAKPCMYTLGNHDWHFPHMPWSDRTRARFYPRFHPMTAGNPAVQALEVGGVRLLAIDNSNYQLDEHQLGFLRRQLELGKPCLLFCHIPFFLPTLAPAVQEQWQAPIMLGAPSWTAEQRQKWQVRPSDPSSLAAVALLGEQAAANLVGIFCGHVHFSHADGFGAGGMQYVTAPGFAGGSRLIRLLPMA